MRELYDPRKSVASSEWLVYDDENCRNAEVEEPVVAPEADVAIGGCGSIEELKANVDYVGTLADKLSGVDIESEEVDLKENSPERKDTKSDFEAVSERDNDTSFRRSCGTVILHHPACALPDVDDDVCCLICCCLQRRFNCLTWIWM